MHEPSGGLTGQSERAQDADERRAEVMDRFRQLKATRDPVLRDQLIQEHLWLARHAARKLGERGESRDDLEQVASYALVKAVDRFDPSLGNQFATFAMPTITGELRRHFRDKSWAMRVPRRIKELHLDLRSMSEVLTARLGRTPTIDELAGALDITVEEVLETLEAGSNFKAASLDAPASGEDGAEGLIGLRGVADERLEDSDERLMIRQALEHLPERERTVVALYYFEQLTQAEIAERVGVSQVHVSRLLRRSLAALRDDLDAADQVA